MTAFFDTSVLFALLNEMEPHHAWSVAQLLTHKAQGPVVIAEIVYCELSYDMATQQEVDAAVDSLSLELLPQDRASLFHASKAFRRYRDNGGAKTVVLPDFLIGALAETMGAPLVTANAKDFRNSFPNLTLITPPKAAKPVAHAPTAPPVSKTT